MRGIDEKAPGLAVVWGFGKDVEGRKSLVTPILPLGFRIVGKRPCGGIEQDGS